MQVGLRMALLAWALAVLVIAPAQADEVRLRLLAVGMDVPAHRHSALDRIGLRDLGLSGPVASAAGTGQARLSGPAAMTAPMRVPVAPLDLRVRRQLPVRWQLTVPVDRLHVPPQVRVGLQSLSGTDGALAASSRDDALLPVRVQTSAPRVAARDDRREVIEGDIWLEFDLADVDGAGHYQGRLTVDLEYL